MRALLQLLVVAPCLVRSASATDHVRHIVEELEQVPLGWSRGSRPPPKKLLTFRLSVNHEQTEMLEQKVIDLSTPAHDQYGKYLEPEQIQNLLRPDPVVSDRILSWLRSENVSASSIETNGNWISFQTTVAQAEHMLGTDFFYYHHHESQTKAIRTLGYSVPREIHPDIQLIQPTTRFGHFGPHGTLPLDQPIAASPQDLIADCETVIRPDCLRDLYGLQRISTTPSPFNRLGVSGFLGQYARHSDFHEFVKSFVPDTIDADFTVESINGGLNDEGSPSPSTEASLDVQYSIAMAQRTLATYFTTGGRSRMIADADHPHPEDSGNEPYLEQLHYLLDLPGERLPAVLTTSYGEPEQTVPPSYARAVCTLFAQLGARGVSVIFSSGDSGVGGTCLSNDGTNRTAFIPVFPASCPFVTSVGGTSGINPEIAMDFSGGGFSDLFTRPTYQDEAVKSYLDRVGKRWEGLYNPHGRGIPDVAAQAKNFIIRDHDIYLKISGTRFVSLSTVDRIILNIGLVLPRLSLQL